MQLTKIANVKSDMEVKSKEQKKLVKSLKDFEFDEEKIEYETNEEIRHFKEAHHVESQLDTGLGKENQVLVITKDFVKIFFMTFFGFLDFYMV